MPYSDDLPRRPDLALPSRRAGLVLAGGAAAIAIYFLLPADAQSVAYVLIGLAAVGAIVAGARVNLATGRVPWYLFAAGLGCSVGGDVVYAVYDLHLGREPPMPSVADALYLLGYPLLALGIVLLLRGLGSHTSRVAVLDMAIVFVAVSMVQWVFFVGTYLDENLAVSERLVNIAYPSMDVLLLVGLLQLIVGPARRSATYRLLVVSVALWVAADEIYVLTADTYAAGSWLDGVWLAAYVAWGAAALDPSIAKLPVHDRRTVPRLTKMRVAVLGLALVAAPASAAIEWLLDHRVHAAAEGIGACLISALVLLRLTGLLRGLEQARTDERLARETAEGLHKTLAEQNARLLELDRLKDEFLASVSHELRTPLTSIIGYLELVAEQEEDAESRNHLRVAERNADRLLGLVDDLLVSASLQAGRLHFEREPVDLHELAGQSVAAAQLLAQSKGVELRLGASDGDRHGPSVVGDPGRLGQVLDNLVSNAIKFTPRGGRVELEVRRQGAKMLLEVTDTGMGIPEREQARLFERFFRSRAALDQYIPGTGLGLYISKAIVEAHGGRIDVRSVVNEGTTFVVELPTAWKRDVA